MRIRVGDEIAFSVPQPTAMLLLSKHPSRTSTIQKPERLEVELGVPISDYIDTFGDKVPDMVLALYNRFEII